MNYLELDKQNLNKPMFGKKGEKSSMLCHPEKILVL